MITSNSGDNTISFVDLDHGKQVHVLSVGREPRHPYINFRTNRAYIPISGSNRIDVIDLGSLTSDFPTKISKVIEIGSGTMPYSAIFSPDGMYAISANNQADYISIISAIDDSVIKTVNVGWQGARGTAYSPDSSVAFVTIEDLNELVVFEIQSGEIINRIPTGSSPRGLLFDEETSAVWVAHFTRAAPMNKKERLINSIGYINFGKNGNWKLSEIVEEPLYVDIPVGKGPCSVSLFKG